MKGVILAGGTGSRLSPLTKVTNKHLLPVYNEPMIYKVIRTLTESGITQITILLGGESVGDFIRLLGGGEDFGAKFSYVYQKGAGGIAEALNLTREIVKGENIAVLLGDNIFEDRFKAEVEMFEQDPDNECYLFMKPVPDPQRFGVAELDENNQIISIEEKPQEPKSNYAVTGLYFYRPNVFEMIDEVIGGIGYSRRGELEITDVNNLYVNKSKAKAMFVNGFWSDAGTFETLLKSSIFAQEQANKSEEQ
ncbi:MAG TPA: sugar phosphate nucleotidyltransferase [Candidatus Lokiarchaeia archaeon]|nr:sugar phosphate nucleotidyltransferase [Candidatus Lokiarchaeia archaeon]